MSGKRPNKLLTAEEKEEKRKLKKKLKTHRKIKKLETRIRHAISRKDPEYEEKTRQELNALLKDTTVQEIENHVGDCAIGIGTGDGNANANGKIDDNDVCDGLSGITNSLSSNSDAKNIILDISKKLFILFSETDDDTKMNTDTKSDLGNVKTKHNGTGTSTSAGTNAKDDIDCSKEHQTKCAVKLLRNMTKGKIDRSMFENKAALIGYTRQKFFERAMLLNSSMEKLQQPIPINVRNTEQSEGDPNSMSSGGVDFGTKQMEIKERMCDKIQSGQIYKACSIGCGPGNDALGLLAFLYNLKDQNKSTCTAAMQSSHSESPSPNKAVALDEIILMDWTIEQWNSAILKPLSHVLNESELKSHSEITMNPYFCDVTKAFNDEENKAAREAIDAASCDIYLTSYLLSETNGKWESFFGGLIDSAKTESIFYFADPTPWQLHRLIELFSSHLDFLWLDSSMYELSMQGLNGRLGPAVLAAIKR
mmetsp:Transcript_10431/g.15716  ORF Transcript_10431/g.15716 Transcript_10431/m.15716 type:complete len:479 (-) Transcript_10431:101-1537(-)